MSFKIEKNDNYAVVKFQVRRLNSSISPSIKTELKTLNSNGFKNIIFDMTNVRFCDSLGLTLILITYHLCKTSNGKFVITGLQEHVKKTIAITQLDSILTIANYLPDALLEMFGASPAKVNSTIN